MSKKENKEEKKSEKEIKDWSRFLDGVGDLLEDIEVMEKAETVDLETAKKVRIGGFPDYEEYKINIEALRVLLYWLCILFLPFYGLFFLACYFAALADCGWDAITGAHPDVQRCINNWINTCMEAVFEAFCGPSPS